VPVFSYRRSARERAHMEKCLEATNWLSPAKMHADQLQSSRLIARNLFRRHQRSLEPLGINKTNPDAFQVSRVSQVSSAGAYHIFKHQGGMSQRKQLSCPLSKLTNVAVEVGFSVVISQSVLLFRQRHGLSGTGISVLK
jgi:hypothetical protein